MSNPEAPSRVKLRLLSLHPSAFLLAAQLLLLILYAVFDGIHQQRALLSAIGGVLLVLIIWVVSRSPARNWIAWLLAVPAFILSLLSVYYVNSIMLGLSSLLEAMLYFYAAGSLIAYMLGDLRVTTDELFAVGATFTLIAWGYAYLYLVLQTWSPGSLIGGTPPHQPLTFIELLFVSFTNLTTAGLSDIYPLTAAARVVMMLEQFTGVCYVAMVISHLVGLISKQRRRRGE
jgi:hypothetical protein